jgi:hypothetical protein
MKRYFVFMIALFVSAAVYGQQRVIKVQGHPHKSLTEKYGGKEDATTTRKAVSTRQVDTTYINPASIPCWINEARLNTTTQIDTAYLIIKWTDGKAIDSVLVWGYRFNGATPHHGIDMLRTVVDNDKRLSLLLQYSGLYGHSVGGIGMNLYGNGTSCAPNPIDFNLIGARTEGNVDFVYTGDTACAQGYGQISTPKNVNNSVNQAKTDYDSTGILIHPFGAEYGYPAYDFDYWTLAGYSQNVRHWQAGWVKNGFWSYYRADNRRVPIPVPFDPDDPFRPDPDASQLGITYEPLLNQQVHGFVFEPAIGPYLYEVHQFDAEEIRYMDCGCAPCPQNVTPVNVKSK